MSKRYETPGPWVHDQTWPTGVGVVSVFVGPAVDKRTTATYGEGAHKVAISGPTGKPRSRTFIGELAWADAARYADDAVQWLRRWEREHWGHDA